MIIRWEQGRVLADRDALAGLYKVSTRSVRRHCPPIRRDGKAGVVLYDAEGAADQLAGVVARPNRTAAAQRIRAVARRHLSAERHHASQQDITDDSSTP